MLGKAFKGLTDEVLTWQTAKLTELATRRDGHVVHVRPELVVEIALDGLVRSPRSPGGRDIGAGADRRLRQQAQRVDVSGSDDGEVAVVQGSDLGFADPFEQCDHAGVHHTEPEVGVLGLQLTATTQILHGGLRRSVGALEHVIEEHQPRIHGQPLVTPVVELGQYQGRYDEVLAGLV